MEKEKEKGWLANQQPPLGSFGMDCGSPQSYGDHPFTFFNFFKIIFKFYLSVSLIYIYIFLLSVTCFVILLVLTWHQIYEIFEQNLTLKNDL
jgi:hypothetical protein